MKTDFTHVYIAKMPEKIGDVSAIYPERRRAYIESAKNEDVRRARYFVWRLLALALSKSLYKDINELDFTVKDGRWTTDACHTSLSHSGGYLAVALSSSPVGVDIEAMKDVRSEKFAERILTPREAKEYEALSEFHRKSRLIELWSKKEAIFKSLGLSAFIPQKIDTYDVFCDTRALSYPEGELVLSIARSGESDIEIYENIEI